MFLNLTSPLECLMRTQNNDFAHRLAEIDIILQKLTDGITIQDSAGRVIYCNDAGAKASNFSSREDFFENLKTISSKFEL